MLQSELNDETPRWVRYNDDASEAVRLSESETFCGRIVNHVDELNRRWRQFEQSLSTKLDALTEARKQVKKFEKTFKCPFKIAAFDQLQRDVRRDLRTLESSLNESASLRPGHPEQKTRLTEAEHRLESELRPSIGQLRTQADTIQRLLAADAALRSDLDDRVDGTERSMEELKTKLCSVKKAAEVRKRKYNSVM